MGEENELEGRVEICYNRIWGMVCSNGWDEVDATVVCKQLGFGQPGELGYSLRSWKQGSYNIITIRSTLLISGALEYQIKLT